MPTIYITQQNALLKIHNLHLQIYQQQRSCISVPLRQTNQIIIFGNFNLPRDVIKTLRLHHIPVVFFTPQGEYLGMLENPTHKQAKYLIQQRQRLRDTEFNRITAKSIIWAKLHNQHLFLQTLNHQENNHTLQTVLNYLNLLMDDLPMAKSLNELQEYDEVANKFYYQALKELLPIHQGCLSNTNHLINRLWNLGYQLLHQYICHLLQVSQLNPEYGIFHHTSYHEFPLACDLMAEFRAPIVDDLVMNFVKHLWENDTNGTTFHNGNGISPWGTILKTFLQNWETKLQTPVLHPFAGEVSFRQCLEIQVQEYIACLLGNVEFYRPLALKFHPTDIDFTNVMALPTVNFQLVKQ